MAQTPNLLNLLSPYNIVVFMLVFTRLAGMIQTAPFFSSIQAPTLTKLWFAAITAFIMYPLVFASKAYIIPKGMPEFLILIAFEFLIGYSIGFIANLILEGVRMAGNVFSIQMALSMSEALDPATGVSSNEISRIYIYLTTLIFLGTGAYQMLFMAVFGSFSSLPIGNFPFFDAQIVSAMLVMFAQIFKVAFGVALPVFSVLLISDILLGMMSKMMPQMNIYMVAIPIKIYIGLFLILAFLSATNVYLQGVIKNYMQALSLLFM